MSAEFWDEFTGPVVEGDFKRTADGKPQIPSASIVNKGNGQPRMETYARMSSFYIEPSNYALRKWGERRLVHGSTMLDDGPHLEGLEYDGPEWRAAVDEYINECMERGGASVAAERGTFAHRLTEFNDTPDRDPIELLTSGAELGVDPFISAAIVKVWQRMEEEYWETLAVEYRVVHDRWKAAGTLDRILRLKRNLTFTLGDGSVVMLPKGMIVVADLKTGLLRAGSFGTPAYWIGYATQIAGYQSGVPFDTDTMSRSHWPWKTSKQYGLIIHIGVAEGIDTETISGRLFLVDLAAGRAAGDIARAIRDHHGRTDVLSTISEPLATVSVD